MTDRTTKILLVVIALGLWANLAASLMALMGAVDQSYELRKIERNVSSIQSDVSDVSSIQSDVSSIEGGTCINSKIC